MPVNWRIIAKALIEPNLRSGRLTGKPEVINFGGFK